MRMAKVILCSLVLMASAGCAQAGSGDTDTTGAVTTSPNGYLADSPEGALDTYMTSWAEGDVDAMWGLHGGRVWPEGDEVTFEQFKSRFDETVAQYAGAPSDMPWLRSITIQGAKPSPRAMEFFTGESLADAHDVGVWMDELDNSSGTWEYRQASTGYLVWQQDGRWVLTHIDGSIP